MIFYLLDLANKMINEIISHTGNYDFLAFSLLPLTSKVSSAMGGRPNFVVVIIGHFLFKSKLLNLV